MTALQKLIELEQDARDFGFDWPDAHMVLDQIIDECREVREDLLAQSTPEKIQEEIGDLLHATISLCLFSGFEVEDTLHKVNHKFAKRMRALKHITKEEGLENLKGKSIDYMLELWKKAKR